MELILTLVALYYVVAGIIAGVMAWAGIDKAPGNLVIILLWPITVPVIAISWLIVIALKKVIK